MGNYPMEIEFNILKSRGFFEHLIVIAFFICVLGFCLYAVVLAMAYFNTENKIIGYALMVPVSVIIGFVERGYDKKVRTRIIFYSINLSSFSLSEIL